MDWFDVVKVQPNLPIPQRAKNAAKQSGGFLGNVGGGIKNWFTGLNTRHPDMYEREQYRRGANDPYHRKRVGAIKEPKKPKKSATAAEKKKYKQDVKRYEAGNVAARQDKQADVKEYQNWMKEQRSNVGRNKHSLLDTNDPMAQSAAKRGLSAVGRGMKEWTGYGWGDTTGKEGEASQKNLAQWRKERDAKAKAQQQVAQQPQQPAPQPVPAPQQPQPTPTPAPAPTPQPATPTPQPAPEAELPQPVKDQLKDPNVPEPDWEGDVRQPAPERDWSRGFSPEVTPATKEREPEPVVEPTSEQTRLGRNLEGHFLPGYGGRGSVAANTNLGESRLDEGQGYREYKDGGEGNVAEHNRLLEEQRKKKLEATSSEQTGLGDFS